MSGCDITSALFNYRKLKFLKFLQKNTNLQPTIEAFKDPNAHQDEIATAGNMFFMALYGRKKETSLNDLRYRKYVSLSYNIRPTFPHYPLPNLLHENIYLEFTIRCSNAHLYIKPHPTSNRKIQVSGVGKKLLVPVPTTLDFAPNSLLRYISCKLWMHEGLHRSPICTSCERLCDNVKPPEDSSDIDVEETEERDRGERPLMLTMEQSHLEPGHDAIEEAQYNEEEQAEYIYIGTYPSPPENHNQDFLKNNGSYNFVL
uniref:Uncharacterized protein LOC114342698 n=1 Tax=Diabrotica virgifera virgifera TaxID=50390 RepID=A0A6P7GZV2_DIAVI